MKRLSSYFIYLLFSFPILPLSVIYFNFNDILKGSAGSIFIVVVFLSITGWFVFFLSRARRVFYKDSSIYAYRLFSKEFMVIDKDNIGGISPFLPLNPSIYALLYYNDKKDAKYIYFIRNPFCSDFSNILDEFN